MGSASLRTRVAVAALAGVAVIVVIAVLVWSAFASANRVGTAVTTKLSPAAQSSSDLLVAYDTLDRESRTYVLTGSAGARSAMEAARARAGTDLTDIERDVAGYPALLADAGQVETTSTA